MTREPSMQAGELLTLRIDSDGHHAFSRQPADDFDPARGFGSLVAHALADGIQELFLRVRIHIRAEEVGQVSQDRGRGVHADDGDGRVIFTTGQDLLTHQFWGQAARHEDEFPQSGHRRRMDLRLGAGNRTLRASSRGLDGFGRL